MYNVRYKSRSFVVNRSFVVKYGLTHRCLGSGVGCLLV